MRESRRGEPSQCRAGGRLPEWGRARRRRSDIAIDRSRARPSDAHPPGIRNGYRREVPNVIIKYNRPERYQPMSEYVYGNGDRVVSRNEFNPDYWHPRWESATYYHQDVLGSTSLMTNERGHTVERYTYDAFGVQTDGSFERVNEIGYTGQRYDPTTNMYNYGFRDYAPSIARFTTVDPIRDGNNWYAYVNNDPVNFVDPLGLIPDKPGSGSVDAPSALQRAIQSNSGFSRNYSACDEFVTKVIEDAGVKPDNWPNPDSHKVGPNENNTPNYIDELSSNTTDSPEKGISAVMMEGGGYTDEHMVVIETDADGSIQGAHYSTNTVTGEREVMEFEADDQKDFEDDWGYDEYHYYHVE